MNALEDEYLRLLELEDCAKDLLSFTRKTMGEYVVNWHHEVIARKLEDFTYQKNKRLMIFLGPRHGKSELVSRRWPAWRLGVDPDRKVVITSYSATLANLFNRDVQRIMSSKAYLDIFPDTRIPDNDSGEKFNRGKRYARTNKFCEVVDRRGSIYSVGVGGSITGTGADDLIIDDPHKSVEEAYSEVARERVWQWWLGTASTRLEKDGNVLLCQTRWHTDDLAGKLLKEAELGTDLAEEWEVVSFPAIAGAILAEGDPREPGEALWPWKYSVERLHKIRNSLGLAFWSALYDQTPVIAGGNIVKEDWFRTYDRLPEVGEWAMSWDLSFGSKAKKSSNVVGQVWIRNGSHYFLVDQYCRKSSFTETLDAIAHMLDKYPKCRRVLIEKKANGAAAMEMLQSRINCLVPITPGGDKVQRFTACSPVIEGGNVWLPRYASWLVEYKKELTSFPASPNDDQVDATSQMLNYWGEGNVAQIIAPPSLTRTTPWR